jgi:light-regulated signal transduction histidine kinase (bacteriophytochrome)
VEWIAAAGRRRTHVGAGVRFATRFMGDVEALKRGEAQHIDVAALPPGPEKEALLASDVRFYRVVPMIAAGELLGALSFGADSQTFRPDQMIVAQEVATQLAIAISQARLLARVRAQAAELEETVRRRTEALAAANKELESFSYTVSHDLRAPLRAVDGYARMLEEDYAPRLDDEGRRLLSVVRESAARMGRLIDDLLAFSRLGRREPAKQTLDMRSLAREVADELGKGSVARVELAELPPAQADVSLIRQVWANLIGNALKYSSKREAPRVEIGGREDGAENVYWVRDNGVGFDMRYAAKLFGVFQRLHRADEFEGTGVGLAIVQRVVSRHGGRVWAESTPGEGACFHFSLPRT